MGAALTLRPYPTLPCPLVCDPRVLLAWTWAMAPSVEVDAAAAPSRAGFRALLHFRSAGLIGRTRKKLPLPAPEAERRRTPGRRLGHLSCCECAPAAAVVPVARPIFSLLVTDASWRSAKFLDLELATSGPEQGVLVVVVPPVSEHAPSVKACVASSWDPRTGPPGARSFGV